MFYHPYVYHLPHENRNVRGSSVPGKGNTIFIRNNKSSYATNARASKNILTAPIHYKSTTYIVSFQAPAVNRYGVFFIPNFKEDGRKNTIPVYSTKSNADLESQVAIIKRQIVEHTYIRHIGVTVQEYAWTWFNTYKSVREINTQAMYKNIINKHLTDIEDKLLCDLKKSDLQLLINKRKDKPRICDQLRLTMSQIIKAAIDDQLLPESAHRNICEKLELPKTIKTEKRPLTEAEKKAIKKADFTDRERAFIYIIFGCGLRRGEALALTKADINLKDKTLTVNKSIAFDENTPYSKSTKSYTGLRVIPMSDFLSTFLTVYMGTLNGLKLFTKLDSNDMTKSSYDKMWKSIEKKINAAAGGTDTIKVVYGLTAHVFRHNYCTQLCYSGLSIKKVAELLGDTEKMVTEVYSHILEKKENATAKINKAICIITVIFLTSV